MIHSSLILFLFGDLILSFALTTSVVLISGLAPLASMTDMTTAAAGAGTMIAAAAATF